MTQIGPFAGTGINRKRPSGGSGSAGVWRSFLSDEDAKTFTKAGGIGRRRFVLTVNGQRFPLNQVVQIVN